MNTKSTKLNQPLRPVPKSPFMGDGFQKAARGIGLTMVILSAIAGYTIHPAVGVGLTILVVIRLWILRQEQLKEQREIKATTVPVNFVEADPIDRMTGRVRQSKWKGR